MPDEKGKNIRALRVRAYQQLPNYRKPGSFLIRETFPLPPYSSVVGMIHRACSWEEYHPMKISIQGTYAGTVSDYSTIYSFAPAKFEKGRHQLKVPSGNGEYLGVSRSPKHFELLTDVALTIHILPEDLGLLEVIQGALLDPPVYLSLGRHEDLIQIDRVDVVELKEDSDGRGEDTKEDIYLPVCSGYESSNVTGTLYRLGKVFSYETTGQKTLRFWKETVLARHVCRGVSISEDDGEYVYIDPSRKEIACFA